MQNTAQDAGGKAGNGQKVAVDVYGEVMLFQIHQAIRFMFTEGSISGPLHG